MTTQAPAVSKDEIGKVTPEMVAAASASVAANLRLYDIDSPSLCDEIAEDALRAGLAVLSKERLKI